MKKLIVYLLLGLLVPIAGFAQTILSSTTIETVPSTTTVISTAVEQSLYKSLDKKPYFINRDVQDSCYMFKECHKWAERMYKKVKTSSPKWKIFRAAYHHSWKELGKPVSVKIETLTVETSYSVAPYYHIVFTRKTIYHNGNSLSSLSEETLPETMKILEYFPQGKSN